MVKIQEGNRSLLKLGLDEIVTIKWLFKETECKDVD
jgi:hypothetical protein